MRNSQAVAKFAPGGAEGTLHRTLAELLDQATSVARARAALGEATSLVRGIPLQLEEEALVLCLKEKAREIEGVADRWAYHFELNPHDPLVLEHHLYWFAKSDPQEALSLLDLHVPEDMARPAALRERMRLLETMGDLEAADRLFAQAIERFPYDRGLRNQQSASLMRRGLVIRAFEIVTAPDANGLPPSGRQVAKVAQAYSILTRYEPAEKLRDEDFRIFAVHHAVRRFARRRIEPRSDGRLGNIGLFTGSLGPGGAERQIAKLASRLRSLQLADHPAIAGDIDVIVKSLAARDQGDFHLSKLVEGDVSVSELEKRVPIRATRQGLDDPELTDLLEHLPSQVHYGIVRLAPLLVEKKVEVASLWQDGSCLIGALAALVARVPNIQLVFRGQPPNLRRRRYRPEYETLLRALTDVPGVSFFSNSRVVSDAYADWLDMPRERVGILYNGVPRLNDDISEEEQAAWSQFDSATSDAEITVGGVFRFETDKQPFRWLDMARIYLRRHPRSRFVLVGGGAQFKATRKRAQTMGIADRILFVGNSPHVGFWYSQMDVKVLLSRFEGLPNVLIEAQRRGVPVVTTPAGGAAETFVEGETGELLDCADQPDLERACDAIDRLGRDLDRKVFDAAVEQISDRFSVDRFVSNFLKLSLGGGGVVSETSP